MSFILLPLPTKLKERGPTSIVSLLFTTPLLPLTIHLPFASATRTPSQSKFTSFKSPNKKKLKSKVVKPFVSSIQNFHVQQSSFSLPDLLPFLSSTVPDVINLVESTKDENCLVDDFHPLGDISNKRVRLTPLELNRNNNYFLQPQPKKIKSVKGLSFVLSDGSSMQLSDSDSSSGSSNTEVGSNLMSVSGISMDGC